MEEGAWQRASLSGGRRESGRGWREWQENPVILPSSLGASQLGSALGYTSQEV